LHLVFRIRLLRKREPTEKRVTSGFPSLAGGKIPRSCHVPTLRVKTRSRAPVRRSAHSLSSCPAALDFVLDRRTWNGHNLRCFSIEQCSALPLVPRYTIRHSRGLTLSSSDLAPLRRKLLLPFLLCFVVRLLRTGADPSAGSLLSSPHGALSYGSKATRLTVVLPLR
jgi:hypothetical protein